jgi:membrane carboxypeptidase/penicillin-binding protein PbpC
VTGVSGAGPIWNEFMRTILKGTPAHPFEAPDGITEAEVCAVSGMLPTLYCPSRKIDIFIDGTPPTTPDTIFQPFTIDSATGQLANENTPSERRVEKVYEVLPQEARDWALRHGIEPPPTNALAVAALGADSQSTLRILMPDPYTVYQLTPNAPFDTQRIRLAAAVPVGAQSITYWIDDQEVDTTFGEPWWTRWALLPGHHTLRVTAELIDGTVQTSDSIEFSVVSYVPPDDQPTSGEIKP